MLFLLQTYLCAPQIHAVRAGTSPENRIGAWNVRAVHTSLRVVRIIVSSVQLAHRRTIKLPSAPPSARVSFTHSSETIFAVIDVIDIRKSKFLVK